MNKLQQISAYLDQRLRIAEITDWSAALNGLQLENSGRVTRIAAAVDACEFTLRAATEMGADLLLVHHGLFWNGAKPLTGSNYRKFQTAFAADLAVYSVHLPLDLHPLFGNNALLCKALGLKSTAPFFFEKGQFIGLKSSQRIGREQLVNRLTKALGDGAVHLCPGGPAIAQNIGVVTGAAGSGIEKAAQEGVDTLITGEAPHWAYTAAEELGINLLLGGHYATETFGVKALAAHLSKKFCLPWQFVDHPTGL